MLEAKGIAGAAADAGMIGSCVQRRTRAAAGRAVDPELPRLRRRVFAGIFVGYAGYYLVRNNLALAIPDLLREHPEYTKAALGTALTGLSIAYGVVEVPDGLGLGPQQPEVLPAARPAAVERDHGRLRPVRGAHALAHHDHRDQAVNGWVQGMGWPPCGKTMVHWFSTKERGLTVSTWNVAHNVGGALVANLALVGVLLFHDWGAKFYFNALIAALIAVVVCFLLEDTPQSRGLPPVEHYKNDFPPGYSQRTSRRSGSGRSFSSTCCRTAISGRSRSRTPSATSCATAS